MPTIRDEDFLTPAQINMLPCYTADRWLQKINEEITIIQVCQDPTVTSLVVIDFVLVGSFYFTPFLNILRVDSDTSYTNNQTSAPLAVGHFRNPSIPISTNCQTFHGQIVFDFGAVIPEFTSASEIEFELGMIGQIPQSFGLSFPNQTPIHRYIWQKGILPVPISIDYQNGNYNVLFEYQGNRNCSCEIQCVVPSGVAHNLQFCPDQKQLITIYDGTFSNDPQSLLIQLTDSIGNTSHLSVQTLKGTIPVRPSVVILDNPRHIEVSISKKSVGGIIYDDVQYQIIKYYNSSNNFIIWKDWSSRDISKFTDYDVLPNSNYGYAVRYKNKFNDISKFSDWITLST